MSACNRLVAAWAAFALVASVASAATAAPAPITGKLSAPGYTVLAVAAKGTATTVRVDDSRFRLRPPSTFSTLHLRARDGTYAGPIVVGRERNGRRALVWVKAGTSLGAVRVFPLRGYARPTKPVSRKQIDDSRWPRARNGVPIGAGKFGLVRSLRARGPKVDPDRDGIPNPLDVDDDGDRVLDNLERSPRVRPANTQKQRQQEAVAANATPVLPLTIDATANANAAGLSKDASDEALRMFGQLRIGGPGELDCGGRPDSANPAGWIGGLVYCTRGGIGRLFGPPGPLYSVPGFPSCCDPDQDGYGDVPRAIRPAATSDQIGTGDLMLLRATTGGTESVYPITLQYVFATVPALVSYGDTAGNAATVRYPVASPTPPLGRGGPGTRDDPFPVAAGPDGQVAMTLTYWRPQRARTAGDSGAGEWVDIGGLTYNMNLDGAYCRQDAYATKDAKLAPPPSGPIGGGFSDRAPDRAADAKNTLTFTLNITQCLAPRGRSFNPGDRIFVQLEAHSSNQGTDTAQQWFWIQRR
jgi:hypothetical protein